MKISRSFAALIVAALFGPSAWAVPVGLGAFSFESTLFGDTLLESDGGTYSASNWLNVANSNPGNPGYLTGANFDTGIANIGLGSVDPIYTIGYATGILNGLGDDLGVVVARFSSDSFLMAVSSDGGSTFSADVAILADSAVSSGSGRTYFYGGGGPFGSSLFVHSIDLGLFGVAGGGSINAVRVSASNQLDLIRVAGFAGRAAAVPEPSTTALFGLGLLGLAYRRRHG